MQHVGFRRIDVTPDVHEKFKNYKYSSAFREKSDADLLGYFLDSFEAIRYFGNIWIVYTISDTLIKYICKWYESRCFF